MNGNEIERLDTKLDTLIEVHSIRREQQQLRDQRFSDDIETLTILGRANQEAIVQINATLGGYKGFVGGAMFIVSALWAALFFFKASLLKLFGVGPC